jgi:hypothetical protein
MLEGVGVGVGVTGCNFVVVPTIMPENCMEFLGC